MTRRPRSFTLENIIWLAFVMAIVTALAPVRKAHAQTLSQPVSIQANNACTGTGFSLATLVQLTLNGTNAGTPQPCGQPVIYSNVITAAGTYAIAFRAGNSAGFAAPSPPKSQQVGESVIPPPIPTTLYTVLCGTPPMPCTPPIVLVPVSP